MDPLKEGTGKHVLLTGANGFVATHILANLLDVRSLPTYLCVPLSHRSLSADRRIETKRDYSVTATVRSESKAQIMLKGHPSWKSKVNFQYIPDITTDGAFDQVFIDGRPFDYIIHAASPLNLEVEDIQTSLIDPAVRG
jgi:nucleoside-diphosphate-sugar epimerase